MKVNVLVKEKEGYNEIGFHFPAMVSAGAFIECLALSSDKDIVFEVTITEEKQEEPKSRFVDPDELIEVPAEELVSVEKYF